MASITYTVICLLLQIGNSSERLPQWSFHRMAAAYPSSAYPATLLIGIPCATAKVTHCTVGSNINTKIHLHNHLKLTSIWSRQLEIIQICEPRIRSPGPRACEFQFGTLYGELRSSSKPCPGKLQWWSAKPVSVIQSAFIRGHYWTRHLAMVESDWTNDSALLITSSCGRCDSPQYYRITLPRHISPSYRPNTCTMTVWFDLLLFNGWWGEMSILWCHLEMMGYRITPKWKSWY